MNCELNNNNTPDSPIVGFLIGIAICIIVSAFHTCATSCSRKVTEHLEVTDSMRQEVLSHSYTATQDSITTSLSNATSRIVLNNTSWTMQTTRTHYSLPDSLGNQYVTLVEQSTTDFGSTLSDSTQSHSSFSSVQSSHALHESTDSILITQTRTITKTKTSSSPVPWYYQYSLYTTLLLLLFIILYILYRKYRRRITNRIAYYLSYNDDPEE